MWGKADLVFGREVDDDAAFLVHNSSPELTHRGTRGTAGHQPTTAWPVALGEREGGERGRGRERRWGECFRCKDDGDISLCDIPRC